MVSKLHKIWSWLFISDPDPDFLPIPDPGSRGEKGTGSRIRIRDTLDTPNIYTQLLMAWLFKKCKKFFSHITSFCRIVQFHSIQPAFLIYCPSPLIEQVPYPYLHFLVGLQVRYCY